MTTITRWINWYQHTLLATSFVCVARRNALKLAQKYNQIGSNACGYDSDNGATMNAGVGINGNRNNIVVAVSEKCSVLFTGLSYVGQQASEAEEKTEDDN